MLRSLISVAMPNRNMTVELGLKRMVALGDDIAQDEAGGKSAQHDIEAKDGRERHERDQNKHRQAHEGLRSKALRCKVRLVIWQMPNGKKKLFFSTDTSLSGED